METYLLRHGIAEEPRGSDAERALTPEGRKKLREVLTVAASAGVKPTLILTSPYKRALQTAEMAAEHLGYSGELVRTDSLLPMSDPPHVWTELRTHKDEDALLLAGHEPNMGRLFAFLLGTPSLEVDFKKGAIARVDIDQFGPAPRGLLRWLLVPKLAARG